MTEPDSNLPDTTMSERPAERAAEPPPEAPPERTGAGTGAGIGTATGTGTGTGTGVRTGAGERGGERYGGGRRRGPGRGRSHSDSQTEFFGQDDKDRLTEKVVFINRSAKVVKGGRRFSFSALIVVGDRRGRVGVGLGKAGEVADAIRKGGEIAKSQMGPVALKDNTIPHETQARYCGAYVLLRPASPGTGVIAGKTVRAVLESVGIKDVLSKSLGSKNAANVVKATLAALTQLRLRETIYRSRGLEIKTAATPAVPAAAPAVKI